jgi:tetratricopeptide repeat protein 21B
MLYLRALLAWKRQLASPKGAAGGVDSSGGGGGGPDAVALLERAVQAHVAAAQRLPAGEQQLVALNPSRLLAVARMVVASLSGEPRAATEAPSPLLGRVTRWACAAGGVSDGWYTMSPVRLALLPPGGCVQSSAL